MFPLPVNIPWRLIGIGVAILACLSSGIWFRGVLADRAELRAENGAQAAELAEVNGEIDRMVKQDALDQALFENVEAQKKILAAELSENIGRLKKLREQLNDKTRDCFDVVLPADYLDGLPKTGN